MQRSCLTESFAFCLTLISIICFGVRDITCIDSIGICPECWVFSDIPTTFGTLCHYAGNFVHCMFISGLMAKPPLYKFSTNNLEASSIPAGNPNTCTLTSQQACWESCIKWGSLGQKSTPDASCAEWCKYVSPYCQINTKPQVLVQLHEDTTLGRC